MSIFSLLNFDYIHNKTSSQQKFDQIQSDFVIMEMPVVKLVVKTNSMQFEDKRIEANAGWNIKELKGKLSELYPTVSIEFIGFFNVKIFFHVVNFYTYKIYRRHRHLLID